MSYLAGTLTPVAPQEPATMPVNRIQFQPGISMPEFFSRYGSEEQCAAALKEWLADQAPGGDDDEN